MNDSKRMAEQIDLWAKDMKLDEEFRRAWVTEAHAVLGGAPAGPPQEDNHPNQPDDPC